MIKNLNKNVSLIILHVKISLKSTNGYFLLKLQKIGLYNSHIYHITRTKKVIMINAMIKEAGTQLVDKGRKIMGSMSCLAKLGPFIVYCSAVLWNLFKEIKIHKKTK